ncbi:MAG: PIG-L family deacetylase, partial [Planctomycetales bacterium]
VQSGEIQEKVRSPRKLERKLGMTPKTLLAVGAHYDDCVFAIPGILLQAAQKNYRIVILSLVGDYTNWRPAAGREQVIIEGAARISKEFGAEMRFLKFASMRFECSEDNKRILAQAVAEIQPDVALTMWPRDHHADHEVAAQLAKVALRHGDRLLGKGRLYKRPSRIYEYDAGPRHTREFEPNVYVDVSAEWPAAMEWLGQLMALVRNEKYSPDRQEGAQIAKETLARYRGLACGVRHAEALRTTNDYPINIL